MMAQVVRLVSFWREDLVLQYNQKNVFTNRLVLASFFPDIDIQLAEMQRWEF